MSGMHIEDIEREVFAQRDPELAPRLQKIFNTSLQIAGLTPAARMDILRKINKNLPARDDEFGWLNLLHELWESPWFECKLLALQLLFVQSELVDANIWSTLDRWTDDIDTWILADWLGHIRSIANKKMPYLVMRLASWLQNRNPLRRRSALVSLVYVGPEKNGLNLILRPREIFAFIEPVIDESDINVVPALAWVLRKIKQDTPEQFNDFYGNVYRQLHSRVHQLLDTTGVRS